ncbi:MAG: NUDIX hydrolase [Sulfuricurvum sp. PC08-66]|nr:MAG: NUDIX hydrolase [Sulfuricurvum sp. PC08-66]
MRNIQNIELKPCDNPKYVKVNRMHYTQEGIDKTWEIAHVHDSVAILLYHQEHHTFVLVKQFRPAVYLSNGDGFTYELCAGICDKEGASLTQVAREEIHEECGFDVPLDAIEHVTSFYTAVGFAGAKQTLFFATVDESMRVSAGGGVDIEAIEVVELFVDDAHDFIFDETKVKTPGLMFAFEWFLGRDKY